MSEERLTRIETKLDSLAEAVVSLARMEERMITLFKRIDKYEDVLSRMGDRLSVLEKNHVAGSVWGYIGDKALWLAVGGIIAWIVKKGI
jgi:CII-binding regulator of phage lambda lysogenization HflD